MCGYTRNVIIRNKVIQGKVEVTSLADKMRKARLRWFRYMKRRCVDVPVRKCERLTVTKVRRGRSKPRKNWGN